MKSVFGAVAVVIGSMIGVGFASGREIASFFAVFGLWGILFCFVAGIVFAFAVYLILSTDNKNSKAGFLFEKFFVVCSFIVMSAMMAGIFELDTSFGGGKFGLAVGIIFCSFVLVVIGLHSLEKLNGFFVPIILLSIIGLFCTTLLGGKSVGGVWAASSNSGGFFNALLHMLSYVGMNVLTITPVLLVVKEKISSKKQSAGCSVLFGVIISILLVFSCLILQLSGNLNSSMPMLEVANQVSIIFGWVYKGIIILGLVATLISSGYVVRTNLQNIFKNKWISSAFTFFAGMLFSLLGFKKIIDLVYPIIGVIGLAFIVYKFYVFKKCKLCKNC